VAPPVTTVGEAVTRINDQLATAGFDAAVSVSLSDDGNSLFLDLHETGQISPATSLERLNSGNGVNLQPGMVRLADGAAIDVRVDLSSATTVGDLITDFNTQLAAAGVSNVTIDINVAGTGLVINDTNIPPLGLTIQNDSQDDNTAEQLGILGVVGPSLIGTDLNPEPSIEITETTGGTAADLGIIGAHTNDTAGTDLDPSLTATSRLVDLRNGNGIDGDRIEIWQGDRSLIVDLSDAAMVTVQDLLDRINASSLEVTASINAPARGIQIENNDPDRSLTVQEVGDQLAARQLGLYGSSDTIGTLLVLAEALKNDDREGIELLLQGIDDAVTHSINVRGSVGSKGSQLETIDARLVGLDLTFTRLLAEVEDADLSQVITDLATYENSYQAALMATARIIQPSLLQFLR